MLFSLGASIKNKLPTLASGPWATVASRLFRSLWWASSTSYILLINCLYSSFFKLKSRTTRAMVIKLLSDVCGKFALLFVLWSKYLSENLYPDLFSNFHRFSDILLRRYDILLKHSEKTSSLLFFFKYSSFRMSKFPKRLELLANICSLSRL